MDAEHTQIGSPNEGSSTPAVKPAALSDLEAAQRLRDAYHAIRRELSSVIVGQDEVIEELMIALFARGHVILEGVPGLAKTLLISSLAQCLGLKFNRVQFTPDLMPSDIIGTEVIQEDRRTGQRSFRFLQGPIFANVILADEVNRTPPKTQAALLEAMQEGQVTVGGVRHPLEPPFFVLATQNPIEQEGTYPLPEAQQDRFMFKIRVGYPSYEEEFAIAERTTGAHMPKLAPVLSQAEILRIQEVVRLVPTASVVVHHALELARCTRPATQPMEYLRDGTTADRRRNPAGNIIDRMVSFGAGPRAVQFLLLGAKARALIAGRRQASIADVRALALPTLRHRILTNYAADAEGYDADRMIAHILQALPSRGAGEAEDAELAQVLRT
ncbi:MAG: AAA family ATPase [Phycisphaerae bacterium]|nr:AAA family ATPase [Phycisphaerae bacterium]